VEKVIKFKVVSIKEILRHFKNIKNSFINLIQRKGLNNFIINQHNLKNLIIKGNSNKSEIADTKNFIKG
jgi:hypothetical protein